MVLLGKDLSAPSYAVVIAGNELSTDVTQFIDSVEFESADGIADMARLNVQNPGGRFTDLKLFQPGNQMDIFGGYGTLTRLGRVQLVRPEYAFPEDAMPTISVTGYSIEHTMMDDAPDKGGVKTLRTTKKEREAGKRVYKEGSLAEVLTNKAAHYFFMLDFDDYQFGHGIAQKAGMSDYDFVKGLANLAGYVFWTDYDDDRKSWVLHCKDPKNLKQAKRYRFEYERGSFSLLSFTPELAIRDVRTKLKVEVRNPDTGKTATVEIEDDASSPDIAATTDLEDEATEAHTSAAAVKVYFGEFSVETITNKSFKTEAQLKRWAAQWFRRHREQFVVGNGTIIGVEDVLARQSHEILGLGNTLDGMYYFSRARHVFSAESGYKVAFTARKEVK